MCHCLKLVRTLYRIGDVLLQWQSNRTTGSISHSKHFFFVLWQHSSMESVVYDGIKSLHIFLKKRDLRLYPGVYTGFRRYYPPGDSHRKFYQNCDYLGCTFLGNGAYSFNQVFKRLELKRTIAR